MDLRSLMWNDLSVGRLRLNKNDGRNDRGQIDKQMNHQPAIREEELKNRVATVYFGRFDCTRIGG